MKLISYLATHHHMTFSRSMFYMTGTTPDLTAWSIISLITRVIVCDNKYTRCWHGAVKLTVSHKLHMKCIESIKAWEMSVWKQITKFQKFIYSIVSVLSFHCFVSFTKKDLNAIWSFVVFVLALLQGSRKCILPSRCQQTAWN